MEQKDLEKIIRIIMNNEVDTEAARLILALVKAINKLPEIKVVPEPYPVYPTNPSPCTPCTPQWDWSKITCTSADHVTDELHGVNNNAEIH